MPTKTIIKEVTIRKWTKPWIIFVISTYVVSIGFFIYGLIEGLRGNTKYQYISNLFAHPSWLNFKTFIATLANDPITDMFLLLFFVFLPVPGLPYYGYEKIELLLAKIGLYQLFITAVLGSPNYNPKVNTESTFTYVIGWLIFSTIVILFIYSFVYHRLPPFIKRFLLEF